MFSKASVDLMYFENLHRIYITDIDKYNIELIQKYEAK